MCRITLPQYKLIKEVKDSSPFTSTQSLPTYIDGVRNRICKWYGIPINKVDDQLVYYFLKYGNLTSEQKM